MLWDSDNERDDRKKKFIGAIRDRNCRRLLAPLSEKILAWESGETGPDEVFKAAGYAARKGEALIADFKKRPDVILAGIAMDEDRYLTGIGDIGISVRQTGLTEVFADAIVLPAAGDGTAASEAAAGLIEEGGASIADEARSKSPIEPMTAIATGPGDLPAANIIHVSMADTEGKITPRSISKAIAAALRLADELEAETVLLPGSAGRNSPVAEETADAILEAIKAHEPLSLSKIIVADKDPEAVRAFVEALEKYDEDDE